MDRGVCTSRAAAGRAQSLIRGSRPTTCFQCHLNVRAQFQLPHRHPVLEGKMSCADCHNPHKGMAIKGGGTSMHQSVKGGGVAFMNANDTCFQCHTAQRGPFVFEHEAVREGCVSCHSPHGSVNQRMLNERNYTLCLKCHFQEQRVAGRVFYRRCRSHQFPSARNVLVRRLSRGPARLSSKPAA